MVTNQLKEFIKKNNIISGGKIVIGVSGGPDSMALAHAFLSVRDEYDFTIILTHVDHMFRGQESLDDMEYVKNWCILNNVHFEGKSINVNQYIEETGLSSQLAARECRYRFFEEIMMKYQADYLALGHHGEDQVETILMRLVRGSSPMGYAGIREKRPFSTGEIIRPFLELRKHDLITYCHEKNIIPRQDPSNEKDVYTRNRFRHHLLPFIFEENPTAHKRFQHFSRQQIEDELYLMELTEDAMNTVIKHKQIQAVTIDVKQFLNVPISLQRRCIQLILEYVYLSIPEGLTQGHLNSILTLLQNEKSTWEQHLPEGLFVTRSYNECTFTFEQVNVKYYTISINEPGVYELPNGFSIKVELNNQCLEPKNDTFICSAKDVSFPLVVRNRKNGDRMSLKGMNGSKKLKDIFIDEKMKQSLRDEWPIITDSQNNILWVPFVKKSVYERNFSTDESLIAIQVVSKSF
ncbi:tRNA lysidine(34) synthetase TilS [Bacillus sp. AFS017336]|uniref:tRNA lysidine(34) synthetase TilS n=1 Tax=Bacillus sp. AFS017336 TaxID=2033489 RepID=UPI000BEFE412|nr:tRNA lysidine(34) synthetase TilS [Bacillus sp. AFS017336]PEL10028.1 tRNA lysidine(34) synthetase TilS [Bacillus sp. AFS017336]